VIGTPIRWKNVAKDRGFENEAQMLLDYRRGGMTYEAIGGLLSVSPGAVFKHAMHLVDRGILKLSDLVRGKNGADE
jgi:hypothetical protein